MNHVAVHDILESDFDAPLTDEALEELGFMKVKSETFEGVCWFYTLSKSFKIVSYIIKPSIKETRVMLCCDDLICRTSTWKTVGGVKMLIEALKGDE